MFGQKFSAGMHRMFGSSIFRMKPENIQRICKRSSLSLSIAKECSQIKSFDCKTRLITESLKFDEGTSLSQGLITKEITDKDLLENLIGKFSLELQALTSPENTMNLCESGLSLAQVWLCKSQTIIGIQGLCLSELIRVP